MRKATLYGVLAGCLAMPLALSSAQAQADFFKGKTVTVVVGARAVGSLSLSAQMLTRHWGRHIPGNPTVILRQMPGGAHLNATNHVFNVAEADGLTILAANPQVAMAQLFKMPAVRFDAREFIWLGSSGADAALLAIHPALPYKTFKDLQNAKEELIVGTTGPGSNAHDVPLLLKEFAGARFKLISGYAANTDIKLALERREVDVWTALGTTVRLAGEQGVVRPMVRSSRAPIPGLDHLPVDEDLATSDIGRALMVIRGTPLGIGRAFGVRPGTPADRVAMLRDSLGKALADPKFLAEAKTAQIDIGHISATR
jgi:tripartite-type tricarboxylate transporter receptor subunit TctC